MNPQPLFCAKNDCPSRGKTDAGNIRVHDSLHDRWKCTTCGKTFTANKGTLYHRLKTDPKIVTLILALLSAGCPVQAIVFAFGYDERTVASWQKKAGQHCRSVHEAIVHQPQDLQQVQADEICVKTQGKRLWMALAIAVTTRLWLGGVIGPHRDHAFLRALARQVNACAALRPLLLVTDGWRGYVNAWQHVFRQPLKTGQRGRPFLLPWPQVAIGQIVKWHESGRVIGIKVCHITGDWAQVAARLPVGQVLNTAYIERLNATFRAWISPLVRRTRSLAGSQETLLAGMYLTGSVYNFCREHESLRLLEPDGKRKWAQRTPAMVAGLTDYCWSVSDLLSYRVAPPPLLTEKRRGRKPKSGASEPKGDRELVTL
jgi:transposase-like protein/IS1 family transposase